MLQARTEKDRMLAQLLLQAGVEPQLKSETVVLTRAQRLALQQSLSCSLRPTRTVRMGYHSTEVPLLTLSSPSIN